MRRHYETFVSEDDFRRMAQIGLNAVRLPVPWYAFGSQESDASDVYKRQGISRAQVRIGVDVVDGRRDKERRLALIHGVCPPEKRCIPVSYTHLDVYKRQPLSS